MDLKNKPKVGVCDRNVPLSAELLWEVTACGHWTISQRSNHEHSSQHIPFFMGSGWRFSSPSTAQASFLGFVTKDPTRFGSRSSEHLSREGNSYILLYDDDKFSP